MALLSRQTPHQTPWALLESDWILYAGFPVACNQRPSDAILAALARLARWRGFHRRQYRREE